MYFPGNLHRVGARLFLNHNHRTLHTVVIGFLRTFLHGIHNPGYVAQVNGSTVIGTHHHIRQFTGIVKLTLHTQGISLIADVEITARYVLVLRTDNGTDCFDTQVVRLQLIGVAVHLDFTLRRTADRHRTHTGNTRQRVYHTVVQYLVKRRLAFVCLYGQQHDRNHIRTELEDDRILHIIGQFGTNHIQLVAHIVCQHVNIITELKLQRNQRHILRRTGSDVLQIAD